MLWVLIAARPCEVLYSSGRPAVNFSVTYDHVQIRWMYRTEASRSCFRYPKNTHSFNSTTFVTCRIFLLSGAALALGLFLLWSNITPVRTFEIPAQCLVRGYADRVT